MVVCSTASVCIGSGEFKLTERRNEKANEERRSPPAFGSEGHKGADRRQQHRILCRTRVGYVRGQCMGYVCALDRVMYDD